MNIEKQIEFDKVKERWEGNRLGIQRMGGT